MPLVRYLRAERALLLSGAPVYVLAMGGRTIAILVCLLAVAAAGVGIWWPRSAPQPAVIDDPSITNLLTVLKSSPGQIGMANAAVAPEGSAIKLTATGKGEHFVVIPVNLKAPGYYILMAKIARRSGAIRLQAWDSSTQPAGALANITFEPPALRVESRGGAEAFGNVKAQGATYEIGLAIRMPREFSHLIVQMTDGQPVELRELFVRRSE